MIFSFGALRFFLERTTDYSDSFTDSGISEGSDPSSDSPPSFCFLDLYAYILPIPFNANFMFFMLSFNPTLLPTVSLNNYLVLLLFKLLVGLGDSSSTFVGDGGPSNWMSELLDENFLLYKNAYLLNYEGCLRGELSSEGTLLPESRLLLSFISTVAMLFIGV